MVEHYIELHHFILMLNGDFDKQNAELCMDFLSNGLLQTLLFKCGFRRDAMVLFVLGELARAFDQWGITVEARKLAVDRARRLIGNWFGKDLGRVGPAGVKKGEYGMQQSHVRGIPRELLAAVLGNANVVDWVAESVVN